VRKHLKLKDDEQSQQILKTVNEALDKAVPMADSNKQTKVCVCVCV
jgi:hypothetical protein